MSGFGLHLKLALGSGSGGGISIIDTPDGFTYPAELPEIDIVDNGSSFGLLGFDITDGMPTGKAYYVSLSGSNGDDGLTPETAFQTMFFAGQQVDADVIYVEAGFYKRTFSMQGLGTATRPLSFIATGGRVTSSTVDFLSWAPDGTHPTVSKATRSSIYAVNDATVTDVNGDDEQLIERASVADVAANPGSFYTDNVDVWVLPSDSRAGTASDETILPMLGTSNAKNNDRDLYLEGIDFYGGVNSFEGTTTFAQVRANDCTFKYVTDASDGGVDINGAVASVFQSCTAARNGNDGFNYHLAGADIPVALEVDCIGRNNGDSASEIDNGSSMHDGGTIIRVNGEYHDNWGPNVVDVNTAFSWCLGTHALDSLVPTSSDFYIDGEMWLDKCSVAGSSSGVNYTAAVGVLNYTNMGTITGVGTLSPYTRTFK